MDPRIELVSDAGVDCDGVADESAEGEATWDAVAGAGVAEAPTEADALAAPVAAALEVNPREAVGGTEGDTDKHTETDEDGEGLAVKAGEMDAGSDAVAPLDTADGAWVTVNDAAVELDDDGQGVAVTEGTARLGTGVMESDEHGDTDGVTVDEGAKDGVATFDEGTGVWLTDAAALVSAVGVEQALRDDNSDGDGCALDDTLAAMVPLAPGLPLNAGVPLVARLALGASVAAAEGVSDTTTVTDTDRAGLALPTLPDGVLDDDAQGVAGCVPTMELYGVEVLASER